MAEEGKEMKEVMIYTDGGCLSNPGPGGYGVVLLFGTHRKELSGGFQLTTNNRMELMAAIVGLNALKEPCRVRLHSDSRYVVDGISLGWAKKWKENNWWRTKSERAINPDLWEQLLNACERHQVKFVWVKGHAGNKENERCDELCAIESNRTDLPVDEGYDPDIKPGKIKIEHEGELCRKCSTPVEKKIPSRKKKKKNKAGFYYEYYLICPKCETVYMPETAKKEIEDSSDDQMSLF